MIELVEARDGFHCGVSFIRECFFYFILFVCACFCFVVSVLNSLAVETFASSSSSHLFDRYSDGSSIHRLLRLELKDANSKPDAPFVFTTKGKNIDTNTAFHDLPPLESPTSSSSSSSSVSASSAAAPPRYSIGDRVDCKDLVDKWCAAEIVAFDEKEGFLIHYLDW